MRKTMFILFHMHNRTILARCYIYKWYQAITRSFIHTRVWFIHSLYMHFPLIIPPLLTWRPPAVMRVVLLSPRLLVDCPLVPHCSPLSLASLPSGLPRNPNVLLIRTHPNPSPSVANSPPWDASITAAFYMYLQFGGLDGAS